ncbi:MAG: leucine-rich repeat domain-containing protein [Bacteroidetes bacterium]|nr:leucine-rich repeat domain-containing protein [Bacteroidota bacterium]
MTINDLYQKLEKAYTLKNLNSISLTIINLYKDKQFLILQKIAEIIEDFFEIEISANGKGFSKLIKLYHPDRLNYYLNEINQHFKNDNYDALLSHAHIFKLERIEEISASLNSYEDIDYSPVYEWDINTDDYNIISEIDKTRKVHTKTIGYNFYDAVKMRQYGNTDMEFPSYYLEDIEEFELSSCDIDDLDGIQYCLHAKTFDLSDNRIVDIELLESLNLIEELNLSNNLIENIDAMTSLLNLKILYLSNNNLSDISPLLELDKLEYVEVSGNKISVDHIEELVKLGVKVDL